MDADHTSLVEQLRQAAPLVPPSHLPSAAELLGVVGALIAYTEFGDEFLEAARPEEDKDQVAAVGALWTPPEAEQGVIRATSSTPPTVSVPSTPGPSNPQGDELDAAHREIAQLRDQLAASQGVANRTTAEVATPPTAPAAVDSPAEVPPPPGAPV